MATAGDHKMQGVEELTDHPLMANSHPVLFCPGLLSPPGMGENPRLQAKPSGGLRTNDSSAALHRLRKPEIVSTARKVA